MKFEKRENGMIKLVGYIVMYLIFTTVLYFILKLLNRLPETWGYIHIMVITLFITLLGKLIKMLLKWD